MANIVRIGVEVKDKASKVLDDIKKQGSQGFGLGVGAAIGVKAMGLLGAALDGAAGAVQGTIAAASDLNETVSKSSVIFGKNAGEVQTWAGTMASAAGVSKRAALDAASGFAGLFKTVGIGIDDSTVMAEKLTQMGSDLASFFNTDVDTALDALKSGLNGEAEPLRAFNVFLSDTAVTAKLASMGIKKVGGQFTEAQKATARYALIMDQTSDAQGDFARTSDGLANTQRQLSAELENVQAEIGEDLLPVMLDLAHIARDNLVPAVEGVLDAVHKAGQGLDWWGDQIDDFIKKNPFGDQQGERFMGIRRFTRDEALAAGAAGRLAEKTGDAAGGLADVKDAAKEATDKLKDMRGAIRDAGKALGDQKFGHQELNLKIKDTKLDLKDNIDRLHDLEAIKHPTRDQRQDIIETKLAIIEDKKEIIELKSELAATGKVNMSVTDQWINRIKNDGSEAADQIAELRRQLLMIPGAKPGGGGGASSGGGGGKNVKSGLIPKASGGPVHAGGGYIVGEQGPELFFPGSNGTIVPNGAGGGLTINVNGVSFMTPGSAQALAAAIAPHVTRWQQQRRV